MSTSSLPNIEPISDWAQACFQELSIEHSIGHSRAEFLLPNTNNKESFSQGLKTIKTWIDFMQFSQSELAQIEDIIKNKRLGQIKNNLDHKTGLGNTLGNLGHKKPTSFNPNIRCHKCSEIGHIRSKCTKSSQNQE